MALPLEAILEGKYEILEKLAEGGVGSLYTVRHRLLEEVRVIKVLRPQIRAREEAQKRFLEEARTAIKLRHPGIAQIFDFAVAEDGMAYIVMEYIDGVALDRALAAYGPPSLDMTLMVAQQTLKALEYLHQNDFVHRDIAPDNVMLTRDHDGAPEAKLIDLGIAKDLSGGAELTAVGTFLGKVRYCSPEHFAAPDGTSELDQRSDIYSFGVMLYELLTGISPIPGDDFTEIAGGHLFKPPIDFAESDPDGRVPEGLRAVVLRALEKDPDSRFATSTEFAEHLAGFADSSANLEQEVEEVLSAASAESPEGKPYSESGTTQGKIDRHFSPAESVDRTVVHKREPERKLKKVKTPEVDRPARPEETGKASVPKPRKSRVVVLVASVLIIALVVAFAALTAFRASRSAEAPSGSPVEVAEMGPRPRVSPIPEAGVLFPTQAPEDGSESAGDEALEGESEKEGPGPGGASTAAAEPPATPPPGAGPPPPSEGAAAGPGGPRPGEPGRRPPPPPPRTIRRGEMIGPGPATVPPKLLKAPSAKTPRAARKAGQSGIVVLEVLVDEAGKVGQTRVVSVSPPDFGFEEAAAKAARKAKYEPATLHGVEGKMWVELRIEFEP